MNVWSYALSFEICAIRRSSTAIDSILKSSKGGSSTKISDKNALDIKDIHVEISQEVSNLLTSIIEIKAFPTKLLEGESTRSLKIFKDSNGTQYSVSQAHGILFTECVLEVLVESYDLSSNNSVHRNAEVLKILKSFGRLLANACLRGVISEKNMNPFILRMLKGDLNKSTLGSETQLPSSVVITEREVKYLSFSILKNIGRGFPGVTLIFTRVLWAMLTLYAQKESQIKTLLEVTLFSNPSQMRKIYREIVDISDVLKCVESITANQKLIPSRKGTKTNNKNYLLSDTIFRGQEATQYECFINTYYECVRNMKDGTQFLINFISLNNLQTYILETQISEEYPNTVTISSNIKDIAEKIKSNFNFEVDIENINRTERKIQDPSVLLKGCWNDDIIETNECESLRIGEGEFFQQDWIGNIPSDYLLRLVHMNYSYIFHDYNKRDTVTLESYESYQDQRSREDPAYAKSRDIFRNRHTGIQQILRNRNVVDKINKRIPRTPYILLESRGLRLLWEQNWQGNWLITNIAIPRFKILGNNHIDSLASQWCNNLTPSQLREFLIEYISKSIPREIMELDLKNVSDFKSVRQLTVGLDKLVGKYFKNTFKVRRFYCRINHFLKYKFESNNISVLKNTSLELILKLVFNELSQSSGGIFDIDMMSILLQELYLAYVFLITENYHFTVKYESRDLLSVEFFETVSVRKLIVKTRQNQYVHDYDYWKSRAGEFLKTFLNCKIPVGKWSIWYDYCIEGLVWAWYPIK